MLRAVLTDSPPTNLVMSTASTFQFAPLLSDAFNGAALQLQNLSISIPMTSEGPNPQLVFVRIVIACIFAKCKSYLMLVFLGVTHQRAQP